MSVPRMNFIRAASSSASQQCHTEFVSPWQLRHVSNFRNGKLLRNNAKPKHVVSMERFLCRAAGTFSTSHDETLESLGLADVVPSHHHRHLGHVVCVCVEDPVQDVNPAILV